MKEALQRIEDDAASIRSDASDRAAQGQGVVPKAEVEKSVQAATSAQAADLKAVQEAQQAAGQQIVETRGQMQLVSDGLNEVAGDTAALNGEVAAAAEPNALPWIAVGPALIALALGIITLVRRRA
jgi:hypothetical protein